MILPACQTVEVTEYMPLRSSGYVRHFCRMFRRLDPANFSPYPSPTKGHHSAAPLGSSQRCTPPRPSLHTRSSAPMRVTSHAPPSGSSHHMLPYRQQGAMVAWFRRLSTTVRARLPRVATCQFPSAHAHFIDDEFRGVRVTSALDVLDPHHPPNPLTVQAFRGGPRFHHHREMLFRSCRKHSHLSHLLHKLNFVLRLAWRGRRNHAEGRTSHARSHSARASPTWPASASSPT